MNILNVEKVSKTFGEKVLLDKVTLGINKGDKVGVIGVMVLESQHCLR